MKELKTEQYLKIRGKIEIRDAHTGEVLAENCNAVVDSGLNLTALLLDPGSGYTGLNFCALGDGDTEVSNFDTTLDSEIVRKQITTYSVVTDQFTTLTFFLADECDFHIEEVGLFGHDADEITDSGVLYNRSLIDYDNSATPKDLVIASIITFEAA
jgi:hypothetical protein